MKFAAKKIHTKSVLKSFEVERVCFKADVLDGSDKHAKIAWVKRDTIIT